MKWPDLLNIVADEPVFTSGFLTTGKNSIANLRLQLSRWVRDGRLIQIRRGLYTLANPYRKVHPHPFLVANSIKKASYVSMQSALSYYGLIPEHVHAVTSVTTCRPGDCDTPLGRFIFRHIKRDLFFGYQQIDAGAGQKVFIAAPEKALFDIIYLTADAEKIDYLKELRLQNLQQLDVDSLIEMAEKSRSAKLHKAAKLVSKLAKENREEEL